MHKGVSARQLTESFPDLLRLLSGDPEKLALNTAAQTSPTKDSIVFLSAAELAQSVIASGAQILVIPEKAAALATQLKPPQTVLTSPNVKLAMAMVNKKFFPLPFMQKPLGGQNIHPTAIIAETAKIGQNVVIGPYAVISEGCVIGDNTRIGANSVIEPNTKLGENCLIHPLVFIGHSCQLGKGVEIKPHSTVGSDGFGYAQDAKGNHYRIPHYGAVIIEDDVHLGANVNIDRGTFEPTRIGRGTKMDNHIHIAHNNEVGENCLMTAGFISAGSTKIGDNCAFGGRSSVGGHLTMTNNIIIGPLGVVAGNMTESGVFEGYPAIPSREFKKAQMSFRHLPRIRKNLSKVMRHLGLEDKESDS